MSGARRKQLLDESKPSHAFEYIVAGAILLTVVLLFTLDLGLDLKKGFERFGGGTGEVDGPQARRWGVAEAEFADALDLPPSGVLARRRGAPEDGALVTLLPRKGSPNAFVKLVAPESGTLELSAFLRAGETLEVALAPGRYELRYAFGGSWFGANDLFGAATRYGALTEVLDLRGLDTPGEAAAPHTLEFPNVVDGEVADRSVARRDF